MSARDYIAALDWPDVLNAGLAEIFQRCDATLAPATLTPAPTPTGLESTGSAVINGLWTLCGTPVVTVPLLESAAGLRWACSSSDRGTRMRACCGRRAG